VLHILGVNSGSASPVENLTGSVIICHINFRPVKFFAFPLFFFSVMLSNNV
jgi:hypothetical protein